MLEDPLKAFEAKNLIRTILQSRGSIRFGAHALEEMDKDDLTELDCTNVLRGGVVREPEYENGEWRYRVETPRMAFVISFPVMGKIRVVTAWRKQR